ncbi:MAG TPA: fused MFS/spermidine synthase [Vicinamibacteria bacterium]|nr:fused MFS/spermidine synthase [Vicinamibacteria bacterium]
MSGASALVYQVAWQRILALHSGVGLFSVAMIVAAFMVGLGLGSHWGGVLSLRLSPPRALVAFALLELGIAAFGAVSGPLFYDFLYLKGLWLYTPAWRAGLLHFLSLLLPTGLMGMSLPFLTRALVWEAPTASRTIGFLYGINVLGASLGALLAPWLLIRHYGIRAAILAAACGNLLAGLGALSLALARGRATAPVPTVGSEAMRPLLTEPPAAFSSWLALYALSGFCALSLEMLWFRLLEVALKSTAFTFGTLLFIYLLGSALGSLAGALVSRRIRRPLEAFLLAQCALLLYSAGVLWLLTVLPPDTPVLRFFLDYWSGRLSYNIGGRLRWPLILKLYVFQPCVLFGLPTVLMGFSFTFLHRAVQDDPAQSGRKVGLLQAANIAGCVAGSLLVGLLLLSWLGTSGTMRLLLVMGLVFAVFGIARAHRRWAFVASAGLLAAMAVAFPGQVGLWRRFHGFGQTPAFIEEDATGVAALSRMDRFRWAVWTTGRHHSTLPFGNIHTALGALPGLLHPAPQEAAVIGLGSGDTAWASGCRVDTMSSVTVFEICAPQRVLLRRFAEGPGSFRKLSQFLEDPRVRIVVADGRNALAREDRRYDMIEMDALWPTSPYAGNLYSLEFYSLCASRLKKGGLMCSWSPSRRVHATFGQAFAHVVEFLGGQVLVGSNDPIAFDLPGWEARLAREDVGAYLGRDRAAEVLAILRTARPGNPPPALEAETNRDLRPRDEFNSP